LLAVGILGMPRRVVSYDPALQGLNISASLFAFVLGASMLFFLVNLLWDTLIKPLRARVVNVWDSLGHEWQLPQPIPVHNFATPPTGWDLPYDYDRDERRTAVPGGGMALPEGVTE
jgi:cytochrome c oxidase subunit 1